MYAIRHKKTNKWVYGTDYRYDPPRQKTSENNALLFEYDFQVETALLTRKMNNNYEIVEVELKARE